MTVPPPLDSAPTNGSPDELRRTWIAAAVVLAVVVVGFVVFIMMRDGEDALVSSTDVVTTTDPGAPTSVAVETTTDGAPPAAPDDTSTVTLDTTTTSLADTTLPPNTTTDPDAPAGTPIVVITADGDAVYFPVGSTESVLLFDGPENDAVAEEGPGPNVVDVVAITRDATTAFVGTCCEPISGAVLRTTPPAVATYEQQPLFLFGYGPAVSPNGALLATALIPGVPDPVSVVDLATGTPLPVARAGELGAFSGFDSMWLDDERVVVLGTEFIGDQNQWVAYPATIVDGTVEVQPPIVIAPAENTGLGTWNFAGRLGGDQFAVHRQGDSSVLALSFSGAAEPVPADDVGEPALRIWVDPGLPTVYVGEDSVLHVGDETLPGRFTWARR